MSRILLVDEDEKACRALHRLLSGHGYEVTTTHSPTEALGYATELAFSIAMVSYTLPGMNGLLLLNQLRAIQPGCLRTLMTDQIDFPTLVKAINDGEVVRILRRPFQPHDVQQMLDGVDHAVRRLDEVARAQRLLHQHQERHQLLTCLRSDHILLATQPILNVQQGRLMAYECLMRSSHPVLNGPVVILRAAERCGLLDALGDLVSARAARILGVLPSDALLFVNLHPEQLASHSRLMQSLAPLLPYTDRCVLELTERSRLADIDGWEAVVAGLQARGFRLALDDLGSGYNALSLLADLQPAFIKLDMSMVRNIDEIPRKQRLVELLSRFGDATGAVVIAEGVETAREAQTLASCGITWMQGYHFARPDLEFADVQLESAAEDDQLAS